MLRVYRVGLILTEDSENWGGTKGEGLWKHWSKRFAQYSDEIQLIRINAVSEDLPDETELNLYDSFIVTGAFYSVNDDYAWITRLVKFIQWIAELNTHKMFGVCFGHQIIAKSFGCTVGKNKAGKDIWKTETLQLADGLLDKEYFKDVFGKRTDFLIMEAHGECVLTLPRSFEVLAWSDTCEYEMVSWSDNVISTQGHPEYNLDVMMNVIAPMMKESLNEDDMADYIKTLTDKDTDNTMMLMKSYFKS